jgi:hypothetical protein
MAALDYWVSPPANPDGMRYFGGEPWKCKCGEPATLFACYSYVSGRAGRVATNTKAVCRACAAKFAGRHGVPMPADTMTGT